MDDQYPPMKPEHTGLVGKCPRCGSGKLFSSYLTVAKNCNVCGLDYDFADAGDGPAFFAICLAIVPVAGLAVWLEVSVGAPYWLNALITAPFLIAACILPIRPLKGYMIAYQYVLKAKEGRLEAVDASVKSDHH